MKKQMKCGIVGLLSTVLLMNVAVPTLASSQDDNVINDTLVEEQVGDMGDYETKEPDELIDVEINEDYLTEEQADGDINYITEEHEEQIEVNKDSLTAIEKLAIYQIYSLMQSFDSSDKTFINQQLRPWLNGFNIDEVQEVFDDKHELIAYAVNLSNNDTEGYVLIGANTEIAPVIEFSLSSKFEAHPVSNWWDRSHANELIITEDETKVVDWGDNAIAPPPAAPNPLI